MQCGQVNPSHFLQIIRKAGFISILLPFCVSVPKVFESISASFLVSFKDEIFPSRVSANFNSVMSTARPLEQRSGFPEAALPPAIAIITDSFVLEMSRNDLIEIVRRFLGWVDRSVSLALDLSDDL